ncbi:Ig-like domain repeat protein [bacterium]|nr:Ig-like domain repeat protein [candidate division CSSED10-310 bacterium]
MNPKIQKKLSGKAGLVSMALILCMCVLLPMGRVAGETRNQPPDKPYDLTPLGYRVVNHNPTVCWGGSDPDMDPVTFSVAIGTSADPTNVVWTGLSNCTTNLGNLVDGQFYYWRVRGYDGQVYGAWSDNQTFGMNDAPSTPTVIYPNGGECLKGITLHTLLWNESANDDPTDPDDSISYTLYISSNGGSTWEGISYTENPGYFEWQSYGITSNQCMFRVIAGDGNETTMDASNGVFSIDSTKPESSCFCSAYANNEPVAVGYTASDTGCGLQEVRLWYKFEAGAWTNSGEYSDQPSGTLEFDPPVGEGTYTFYTVAKDLAGNQEVPPAGGEATVIYDTTDPTSSTSSIAYTNVVPLVVDFVAYDELSGVLRTWLWYRYEGGSWNNTGLNKTGLSGSFNFSPSFGDGEYEFKSLSEDNAGNSESKSQPDSATILDRIRPTSAVTPVPQPYTNQATVSIPFTAQDSRSGIEETVLWHRVNAGGWVPTSLEPISGTSGSFSYTFGSDQAVYYFATRAQDRAGNQELTPTGDGDAAITYDYTTPVSAATCNLYANASPVIVSFTASDNLSGVDETNLWFKYGINGTWIPSGLTAQSGTSGSFQFTPYTQGTFYFATVCEDMSGNSEANPQGNGDCYCTYDIGPPTSEADCEAFTSNETIPVTWSANDDVSGLERTTLWYKFQAGAWTSSGMFQTGSSGEFEFTPVGQGTYYFATVARDRASNVEDTPTGSGDCSTVYDSLGPQSSATCNPFHTGGSLQVSWTATDNSTRNRGIQQVVLWYKYTDGGTWGPAGLPAQSGTSGIFMYTPVQQGRYYFATKAYDTAGNEEGDPTGSGDCSTFFDSATPTAAMEALPSVIYTNLYLLEYELSDPEPSSGLASVRIWYRKDAGAWTQGVQDLTPDGEVVFDFSQTGVEGFYEFEAVATDSAGNAETRNGIPEAYTLKQTERFVDIELDSSSTAIHPGAVLTVDVMLSSSVPDPTGLCDVAVYVEYDPDYFEVPELVDLVPLQDNGTAWEDQAVDAHWDDDGIGTDAVQFEKHGSIGMTVTQSLTIYHLTFAVKCDAPALEAPLNTIVNVMEQYIIVIACGGNDIEGDYEFLDLTTNANGPPTDPTLSQGAIGWGDWTNASPLLSALSVDPQGDGYRASFRLDGGAFQLGSLVPSGTASTYQPSGLSDGPHVWSAYSSDACEDSDIVSANGGDVAFRLDTLAPGEPIGLSAAPDGWTNINSFTLTWNNPVDASGIAGVYYKLQTPPINPTDGVYTVGNDIEVLNGISAGTDGAIPVYIWLKDVAGNADHLNSSDVALYLDRVVPEAHITLPGDGLCTGAPTVQVSGTASDALSGVEAIEVSSDNGGTWTPATGGEAWAYTWTPTGEGDFQLLARVTDEAGNQGLSTSVEVTIDRTAPVSDITEPSVGDCLSGSVTITGTSSDQGCGVESVLVSVDGGATYATATGTETWSYVWAAGGEGEYTILVKAVDLAGNEQESPATVTVTIDQTGPATTIEEPEDGACLAGGLVEISGTADDGDGCGVTAVFVSFDDGATWEQADGTTEWTYQWNAGEEGTYTISVVAADAADNAATPDTITVNVDLKSPTIWFAGFWDAVISESSGGAIMLMAFTPDTDIERMEVFMNNQPTGLTLVDDGTAGDWNAGDGLFTLLLEGIGPGAPAGQYPLAIKAYDACGNVTDWPALVVE